MSNSDRTRYAIAAMAVKELHPKMMRKLAGRHKSATTLHGLIEKNVNGIKSKLQAPQLLLVPTLLISDYDMFDETLMYKMISFFEIVQRPSKGWGNSPERRDQTTLGDDIERLQKRRNALVHSPSAQLSESTFEEYFHELREIAQRFDTHLHQSNYRNRFEDEVFSMKRQSPDPETQAKYIAALEKIHEMKSKYYLKTFD